VWIIACVRERERDQKIHCACVCACACVRAFLQVRKYVCVCLRVC